MSSIVSAFHLARPEQVVMTSSTRFIVAVVSLLLSVTDPLMAQDPALKTRIVATDLYVPWELVWGPDNKIWITELRGGISTIDPTTGEKNVLLADLPDRFQLNESGLLGMVLHPQFADNPYVYIGYTYLIEQSIKLKVVRYRYDGSTLVEPFVLLGNIQGGPVHNGCRLAFGSDGMLYFTAGDGGNPEDAQKLDFYNGKVLRINPNGSIPSDNPIPGSPLWTWGHRNSQGLTFGPNDVLYSSEHGATTDDEVNIIMKGRNYGWSRVEGLCNAPGEIAFCADSNVVEPIGTPWTPTIAPGAIKYYNSDLIPQWKDHLLMTAMKQQATLVVMELSPDRSRIVSEQRLYRGVFGRLRSLCVSPDGRVFMGTTNRDVYGSPDQYPGSDHIIEITPQSSGVKERSTSNAQQANVVFKITETQLTAFVTDVALFDRSPDRANASNQSSGVSLTITDVLGRVISEHGNGVGGFHIDIAHLTSGMYTAIVHTSSGAEAFTFVR